MADDEFKGEFDFGFNLVDEDELEVVQQLQTQTVDVTDAAKNIEKDLLQTDAKLNTLYNAIQPLLRNLTENPEKEYVYWPDRVEKVRAFKEHLDKIYKGN
tara:strand:+ start:6510 stop:6809 length:300 start_codon:yes stop_codon:yes gene_type:complete